MLAHIKIHATSIRLMDQIIFKDFRLEYLHLEIHYTGCSIKLYITNILEELSRFNSTY